MIKVIKSYIVGFYLLANSSFLLAAVDLNIDFNGGLIVNPPCELTAEDGSDTINVDFKDIVIRRMAVKAADHNLTSAPYQQVLPFRLVCDAPDDTAVRIGISGSPAGFNAEFLGTDNQDVGIQFINLGKGTFIPNNRNRRAQIILSNLSSYTFYVVPIRNNNVSIDKVRAGGFKATATFVAEYE